MEPLPPLARLEHVVEQQILEVHASVTDLPHLMPHSQHLPHLMPHSQHHYSSCTPPCAAADPRGARLHHMPEPLALLTVSSSKALLRLLRSRCCLEQQILEVDACRTYACGSAHLET